MTTDNTRYRYLTILCIVIISVLSYRQVIYNDFVRYDDFLYITQNQIVQKGLCIESIKWAFSLSSNKSFWHPLTWLSLMLDYQFFGDNPVYYHLENLFIHILNSLLLFLILNKTTKKFFLSSFVAFLFALHPVNVETVAWAAERKSLLSCFFGFAAILAYHHHITGKRIWKLLTAVLLFVLSLLAKPMFVTLPFALILIDFWPLNRIRFGNSIEISGQQVSIAKCVYEKVPFFFAAALSSLLTMKSISGLGISEVTGASSFAERLYNALISYISYIFKMIWPAELPVFYPFPAQYPVWQVSGAVLILALISFYAFQQRQRLPWLFFGWFWYLVVFLPMIGIIRNGLWAAMANRHAYLPLIGLYVAVAWGGEEIAGGRQHRRTYFAIGAVGLISILAICSHRQVKVWKNTFTLFEYTMSVTKDNYIACGILGDAYYLLRGDFEKARELYVREYKINPFSIRYDVGNAVHSYETGDYYTALHWLRRALLKNENFLPALYYTGEVNERMGSMKTAAAFYALAMESKETDENGYKERAKLNLSRLMKAQELPVQKGSI